MDMAGAQVGCIAVSDSINVQAFIEDAKSNKYVVEKEQVDDKGNKYIPIHKAN
jgi:hypothetical protein